MIKKIKSFLFENRNNKQTVAKNTLWLTIGTVASRVIKALIIIYAARRLGTENYGVFSYALSLSALFSILADIGMSTIIIREISQNAEKTEKILGTSLVIKVSLVLFSLALVLFIAPLFSTIKGASALIPLAALLIAFDALRDFAFSITRAKEKMEIEAAINFTTGVGITIFGFGALWLAPNPMSLMIGYVMGSALGFFLAFFLLRKYVQHFWHHFDKELAKQMIRDVVPFAIIILLGALTINTDTIMIGWLRNAKEVGLYSAAQRPVLLIYLISSLLATSVFPIITRSVHKNNDHVRSILEKTVSISLLVALPIFVGGAILSQQIISFLFGSEFLPITTTFSLLLFTILLMFPGVIILNTIFAYNKQKIVVTSMILGGVGNVILNYLFIPTLGMVGSALATIISQTLAYGFAWKKMKDINNFYTLKHIKKGVSASIIMGIFSYIFSAVGIQVIINIVASGFIYLGVLIFLKEKLIKESLEIFEIKELKA
ncbi:MAG: flippase [Candidatus Paceibacterota bacterium]|jgi:O-antigen/teichoic acid export membrane protein